MQLSEMCSTCVYIPFWLVELLVVRVYDLSVPLVEQTDSLRTDGDLDGRTEDVSDHCVQTDWDEKTDAGVQTEAVGESFLVNSETVQDLSTLRKRQQDCLDQCSQLERK